jgi:NAD(P)-dependent dehydrogenase (short-subunit alcohol dehydrogenase family)
VILVTGGLRMIGAHTGRALVDAGREVVAARTTATASRPSSTAAEVAQGRRLGVPISREDLQSQHRPFDLRSNPLRI